MESIHTRIPQDNTLSQGDTDHNACFEALIQYRQSLHDTNAKQVLTRNLLTSTQFILRVCKAFLESRVEFRVKYEKRQPDGSKLLVMHIGSQEEELQNIRNRQQELYVKLQDIIRQHGYHLSPEMLREYMMCRMPRFIELSRRSNADSQMISMLDSVYTAVQCIGDLKETAAVLHQNIPLSTESTD